jgi:regulator of protease activity HflC (stomatin/prohibitin superfamily)
MEPVTAALSFLFFGFIAIVLLVIAVKTIRIVPQATVMLVERLGRFDRPAKEGLNILVPFIDKPRRGLLDQLTSGPHVDRLARTVHRPAAATRDHA